MSKFTFFLYLLEQFLPVAEARHWQTQAKAEVSLLLHQIVGLYAFIETFINAGLFIVGMQLENWEGKKNLLSD